MLNKKLEIICFTTHDTRLNTHDRWRKGKTWPVSVSRGFSYLIVLKFCWQYCWLVARQGCYTDRYKTCIIRGLRNITIRLTVKCTEECRVEQDEILLKVFFTFKVFLKLNWYKHHRATLPIFRVSLNWTIIEQIILRRIIWQPIRSICLGFIEKCCSSSLINFLVNGIYVGLVFTCMFPCMLLTNINIRNMIFCIKKMCSKLNKDNFHNCTKAHSYKDTATKIQPEPMKKIFNANNNAGTLRYWHCPYTL